MELPAFEHPVVQAPMAGGPSTPDLAVAVSEAGGLGFLAAGYKTAEAVGREVAQVRSRTGAPFGVNLFVPSPHVTDPGDIDRYAAELASEADRYGVPLGAPADDDDEWADKLALLLDEPVPVVSFTFGCPPAEVVDSLHAAGTAVAVTVTDPDDASVAVSVGADALVVQGLEAGAHQGSFRDADDVERYGLLVLLRLVARVTGLPLIATGGIVDGASVAAVLVAGAHAAQLGTAFLRCPEAGTGAVHRAALAERRPTALTRAFTGRTARGLVNRFMVEHSATAPVAYPQVHHLTSPLRAAARDRQDPDGVNLWAGQGYRLAEAVAAGDLVRRLADDAAASLRRASIDRNAPPVG